MPVIDATRSAKKFPRRIKVVKIIFSALFTLMVLSSGDVCAKKETRGEKSCATANSRVNSLTFAKRVHRRPESQPGLIKKE
jgi:hypothetical protein